MVHIRFGLESLVSDPSIPILPVAFENCIVVRSIHRIFPALNGSAIQVIRQRVLCVLRRISYPEPIGIRNLTCQIDRQRRIVDLPKLAHTAHRLQNTGMAANLDLRGCPPETPVLRLVDWYTAYFGMPLGVVDQLLFPLNSLFFWDNVAQDHAAAVADEVCEVFGELAAYPLDQ